MQKSNSMRIRAFVLSAFVLVLAAAESRAIRPYRPIHPDPVSEPWRWRSFPKLKGQGLRCLAEAKDGAMWFGTDEGVQRYDGLRWTLYTPEDGLYGAPVNVLCATQDGSVYAGTDLGISRFVEGVWRRVFPPEGDLPWPVNDLMEAADGSLWAGTAWGALWLDRERSVLYATKAMGNALRVLSPYVRLSIVPDEAAPARPWGEGIGVQVAEGAYLGISRGYIPIVIWALAPGGPGERVGLRVGDRITAVDGQPWVTPEPWVIPGRLFGPAGTLVRLAVQREGDPDAFEVTVSRESVEGTYRDFSIHDVYEDREGTIWFGLCWGEIVRCDIRRTQEAGAWRLYTKAHGLDIGYGPRIVQTRDGTIWTVSHEGNIGVNRFDGRAWTYFHLGDDTNTSIVETKDGTLWVGGSGLYALRDGAWKTYGPPEIPSHRTRLLETSDGALWVAGLGQEAARLDYRTPRWTTYEGLNFRRETSDGALWFVSQDGGIVRCDARTWTRYGDEDGLMSLPWALCSAQDGTVWAAGSHNRIAATARFDGRRWSFETHPEVSWAVGEKGIYESSDGSLWFGAVSPQPGQLGGVLQFDGKDWIHHKPPDAPQVSYGIGQTPDGMLWFGGWILRRFDGQTWTPITEPGPLASWVEDVYRTDEGDLWVGTRTYGVFRFDGQTWTQYDVQKGLADNRITVILETDDGSVWVGTERGISRFDGRSWDTHALPPGLASNIVGLHQCRDGAMWINGLSFDPGGFRFGTTRYVFDADPPETEITLSVDRVSQPGNTALAWTGTDPWCVTSDEKLQYACRLDGEAWSPFSAEKSSVFPALRSGNHTFEVKARDSDFNEDPTPAVARFTVVPPVWRQPWFIGLMVVVVGTISFLISRVETTQRKLIQELEKELQTAHDLQMGLMPEASPRIPSFDIAGRCLPANRVGGDYFDYIWVDEEHTDLCIVLADVAGNAMQAAIPVVMFSGMLHTGLEHTTSPADLLNHLNRALPPRLAPNSFISCCVAFLDVRSKRMVLCNAGQPGPLVRRGTDVRTISMQTSHWPLGIVSEVHYEDTVFDLREGDVVWFHTDGGIEARNEAGELYGFDRLESVLGRGRSPETTAEGWLEGILEEVRAFSGTAPQHDDMTFAVLKVG